jgi:hypothetical protein
VQVPVGAQNVRQHRGITGIGFAAGLRVPFPVAGHRARVDRIQREPGLGQRDDEQVLVSFERDRRLGGAAAVLGDQREKISESGRAGIDSGARDERAVLVDQRDVVVRFGPIDPAR